MYDYKNYYRPRPTKRQGSKSRPSLNKGKGGRDWYKGYGSRAFTGANNLSQGWFSMGEDIPTPDLHPRYPYTGSTAQYTGAGTWQQPRPAPAPYTPTQDPFAPAGWDTMEPPGWSPPPVKPAPYIGSTAQYTGANASQKPSFWDAFTSAFIGSNNLSRGWFTPGERLPVTPQTPPHTGSTAQYTGAGTASPYTYYPTSMPIIERAGLDFRYLPDPNGGQTASGGGPDWWGRYKHGGGGSGGGYSSPYLRAWQTGLYNLNANRR